MKAGCFPLKNVTLPIHGQRTYSWSNSHRKTFIYRMLLSRAISLREIGQTLIEKPLYIGCFYGG